MKAKRPEMIDAQEAVSVATHPSANESEREAAAYIEAAYHLNTICESEAVVIVQKAAKRLGLY